MSDTDSIRNEALETRENPCTIAPPPLPVTAGTGAIGTVAGSVTEATISLIGPICPY